MAENIETTETTENKTPETWDELKSLPLFEELPDMVKPQELNVAQSAEFRVTWQRVSERQTRLFDTGVFDDETADKGKKKTKEKRDEDEAVVLMAEIAQYADMFYRDIAVDEKQWEEFTKGRTLEDLFVLLVSLTSFYALALGKSSGSKTRLTKAE
ncbi:hypothetical protein GBC23_01365 [Bifidobacterium longum]|uniref:Uncharacterized protein n=1 Tax=Bifidobacterium longum TaxID=216816 RepID=A0A6I1D4H4_BIFLN|nr:hypothetical protein [Bifidobacterium longum]KAB7221501.1 hypothetical protein GBC54_02700 [Bifidobacterium longum]KAB7223363.1 hypothetical protein GBC31_02720 [Bifidobacterium longum]KAB7227291.1 hypothetical protein GBC52_02905 [Bifidobacterium longum]KAB7227646.1 hypothetical protein GBC23_01365 [Bifidobacterium longum]KAB7228951.1 hypothetical protein GBC44_06895 [Bifidobacterium longum]